MKTSALALLVVSGLALVACQKDEAPKGGAAATPTKPPAARVTDAHYAIELKPDAECRAGAECVARIELDALGGYHVNKEYPYKFTANPSKTLEYLGKDPGGATWFTKPAGDHVAPSEGHATMTLRYRPKQAGPAEVAGTYKFSVCSEQNCQIETAELLAKVDVK